MQNEEGNYKKDTRVSNTPDTPEEQEGEFCIYCKMTVETKCNKPDICENNTTFIIDSIKNGKIK